MAGKRARIGLIGSGTCVLILVAVLIHQRSGPPQPAVSVSGNPIVSKNPSRPAPAGHATSTRRTPPHLAGLPAPEESPHLPGSAAEREWLDQRKEALDDLTWFEDPASLGKILAELGNPVPEIRNAALEATRDFGSREAIPYLKALSDGTVDSLERKELQDLIAFLDTPTLLELSDGNGIE